jgi:hypothetical protein
MGGKNVGFGAQKNCKSSLLARKTRFGAKKSASHRSGSRIVEARAFPDRALRPDVSQLLSGNFWAWPLEHLEQRPFIEILAEGMYVHMYVS